MDYLENLQSQVQTGKNVFIAYNATVLGQVSLADHVSVWYNAVIRADYDRIEIGYKSNVQDGVIIHIDKGEPVVIGEEVVLGHQSIIHGATVGNQTLIGMRATVMNGARIGKGCIIGAHALVTENMNIPDYSMALGIPARIVKKVTKSEVAAIRDNTVRYAREAGRYLK